MDAGRTLIFFVIIFVVIAGAALLLIREKRKRKELCKEIEMLLAAFTNWERRNAGMPETAQGRAADNEHDRAADHEYGSDYETSSADLDRIYRQLTKIQSFIGVLQDRAELEREEIKSIVTDISHQLKTPVAVMDMSLSLLEDESLSPTERSEFMGRLRGSMKELETLMDSLIQISRMESGLITLNLEEKPLADTIMMAVNSVFLKADEKQINIELEDKDEIARIPVSHDGKWLGEAFINILENAVKYSPADSCITIRPSLRNGFVRLEIEDQGIGIPKEERNKVFTRFYRGKSKWVQEETGSGVGLFLVNKILRMHGGMVLIRSGKGGSKEYPGTILVLQIPLANS